MSNAVADPIHGPETPIPEAIRPTRIRPVPVLRGIESEARAWILVPGSMTRAIATRFGSAPTVTPTRSGPSAAAPWEARLLGVPGRCAFAREVTLAVAGTPVLQARTLSRLGDPAVDVLRKLGRRPLAEALFQDPAWHRITAPIPLLDPLLQRPGRASLWQYGARGRSRILVEEYLLPALLAPVA